MQLDDQPLRADIEKRLQQLAAGNADVETQLEAMTAALHEAADQYAEAEYQGISDVLVLLAELLSSVPADVDNSERNLLLNLWNQAFAGLFGKDKLKQVVSVLTDPRWPEPLSAEDVGFIEEILAADLERREASKPVAGVQSDDSPTMISPSANDTANGTANDLANDLANDRAENEIAANEKTDEQTAPVNHAAQSPQSLDADPLLLKLAQQMGEVLARHKAIKQSPDNLQQQSEQLIVDIHQLAESCSDIDFLGFSDLFALYAEFLYQDKGGFDLSTKLGQILYQKVAALVRAPSPTSVKTVLQVMAHKLWPNPLSAEDVKIISPMLYAESEMLAAAVAPAASDEPEATPVTAAAPAETRADVAMAEPEMTDAAPEPIPAIQQYQTELEAEPVSPESDKLTAHETVGDAAKQTADEAVYEETAADSTDSVEAVVVAEPSADPAVLLADQQQGDDDLVSPSRTDEEEGLDEVSSKDLADFDLATSGLRGDLGGSDLADFEERDQPGDVDISALAAEIDAELEAGGDTDFDSLIENEVVELSGETLDEAERLLDQALNEDEQAADDLLNTDEVAAFELLDSELVDSEPADSEIDHTAAVAESLQQAAPQDEAAVDEIAFTADESGAEETARQPLAEADDSDPLEDWLLGDVESIEQSIEQQSDPLAAAQAAEQVVEQQREEPVNGSPEAGSSSLQQPTSQQVSPQPVSQQQPTLLQHMQAALAAQQTEQDTEALVDQFHHLVELCSDHEMQGLADLFALYAELLQVDEPPVLNEQPAFQTLYQALVGLAQQPTAGQAQTVINAMGEPCWAQSIGAEDLAFLEPLLLDDIAWLTEQPAVAENTGNSAAADSAETANEVEETEESADSLAAEEHANAVMSVSVDELLAADNNEDPLAETDTNTDAAAEPEQQETLSDRVAVTAEPVVKPDFLVVDFALLNETPPAVDQEVVAMLATSLDAQVQQWQELAGLPAAGLLQDTASQLASLARAMDTVGLVGARFAVNGLVVNLEWLLEQPETLDSGTVTAISNYLQALASHLTDMANKTLREDLIDCCAKLPCAPDIDQSAFLTGLLTLAMVKDPKDIVRRVATAEEVMLASEKDVDPELASMLNHELPQLSEQFSAQLQAVTEQGATDSLRDAQRTAHTIKGLANMAGIPGLANLTHYLEDILELLTDAAALPSVRLSEDMLDASDCLAAMSDCVTAHEAPPASAQACLQTVFDWHYLAKTQGLDAITLGAGTDIDTLVELDLPAEKLAESSGVEVGNSIESQSQTDTLPVEKAADDQQATLSVSANLLDTLFRIAGESTTLNTQLDEELTQLRRLTRTSRDRYRAMERVMADLEQRLNEYSYQHNAGKQEDDKFDELEMDRYNELHSSISRLHEASADVSEVNSSMNGHIMQLIELHSTQSGLQKESLENIIRTRMVPVSTISARIQRIVRQACRATGKKAQLIIEGEDVQIDSQVLRELTAPLMHIIRNSVDHGLETPHLRFEAGKDETGTIRLGFQRDNDKLLISCQDDGAGINTERVRAEAEKKGLIDADAQLSDHETQRLILLPGFSTREETSHLSGRGIGMDIVSQQVNRLHGMLNISSEPGQSTRIELSLPPSSLMVRVLLVRAGQQLVTLSTQGIEQSLLSIDGEFTENAQGEALFVHQGHEYPVMTIESLTGKALREYPQGNVHPVLLINLGDEQVAVRLHEILAHRELIFKEMSELIPIIPGISGLTILANGEVAPVIDLPARIRHTRENLQIRPEMLVLDDSQRLTRVMVVDDSISARKSLVSLLQDVGYEVSSAIDGLDAMNKIRKDPPDILLTDYEMPRMNGVELSSSIKHREETGAMPIIMITSRSTAKHRMEADNAGVDRYLTKPWTETQLLATMDELLQGKIAEAG